MTAPTAVSTPDGAPVWMRSCCCATTTRQPRSCSSASRRPQMTIRRNAAGSPMSDRRDPQGSGPQPARGARQRAGGRKEAGAAQPAGRAQRRIGVTRSRLRSAGARRPWCGLLSALALSLAATGHGDPSARQDAASAAGAAFAVAVATGDHVGVRRPLAPPACQQLERDEQKTCLVTSASQEVPDTRGRTPVCLVCRPPDGAVRSDR